MAAMGLPQMVLIDFDKVEAENLGPQGFRPDQIGQFKTECLLEDCQRINPEANFTAVTDKFRAKFLLDFKPTAIISCVDSMRIRAMIWENIRMLDCLFIDTRMSSETCEIYSSEAPHSGYYETTLFEDAEAYQGSCTAKSTIYCANIAAGLAVSLLSKAMRGISLEPKLSLNILGSELEAIFMEPETQEERPEE